mgnify:CR=1 FL=1
MTIGILFFIGMEIIKNSIAIIKTKTRLLWKQIF